MDSENWMDRKYNIAGKGPMGDVVICARTFGGKKEGKKGGNSICRNVANCGPRRGKIGWGPACGRAELKGGWGKGKGDPL